MGCQRDLVSEIGLPRELECPACKATVQTAFDDYDIEGGRDPNPEPGVWVLGVECHECTHEWRLRFVITVATKGGAVSNALTRQGVDDLRERLSERIGDAQLRVENGAGAPLGSELRACNRARAAEELAALLLALDRSYKLLSQKDMDRRLVAMTTSLREAGR
jgi:hypothetical protein